MTTTGPLYPVGLVVQGRRCLVVGGGRVATRKVAGLRACGALVTVVAPETALASAPGLTVERRPYRPGEAAHYQLVVTATGDPEVDGAVARDADNAGVWVNAADDPAHCSFTLPAVERRGPVTVAVSTDGAAPALAVWLRDRLAAALPEHLDELAAAVEAARRDLRARGESTEGRAWAETIETWVSTGAGR